MKNTLLFLFISTLLTVNAQTVNIDWIGAKSYSVNYESNVNLPFFNNEGYTVINNVPLLMHLEKVAGMGKVTIQNIEYTSLNASERGQLNINEIPSTLEYDARIQKGGDEYSLTVSMIPFVKEGNQIRKVSSFEIVNQQGVPPDYQPEDTYDPATQSVLRSGNWYKVKIKKSGVFRLDRNFFTQNGIPTNFDPRTLKIYGNGGKMLNENPGDFRYGGLQENAIQFNGEEDGSFDNGDFILFYGQGPHDWNRTTNSTLSTLSHRFNVYSDEAYYFITFGGQVGKRVQEVEILGNPSQTFNQYHEYVFHEKDSINLNNIGRQWGGEMFNLEPSQNFILTGNAPSAGEVFAKFRLLGKSANNSNFSVSLNGASVGSDAFIDSSLNPRGGQTLVAANGNIFTFNVTVQNGSPNAIIFLDYLEVKYLANLSFNGNQMRFRRLENLNDGNIYGFSISGAQKVWNISDITSASNVSSIGGVYKYQSTSPYFLNEFIAFNENSALTEIEYSGSVTNQNIRALKEIDYAIVVHPDYLSEASRLANFRQTNDGVKVAVVTTEQVYNDFSSGAQDISAIRDFFKHLRDQGSPLKYVMLFGGASYDFKSRILNNTNFVPSYQSMTSNALGATGEANSYVTDDFFAMLDDTDIVVPTANNNFLEYSTNAAPQMDVAIGRMPAHSSSEARVMVDKTIAYYNKQPNQGTSFGDWKTKFYLVVDDDDPGPQNAFHTLIEATSAQFIENNIDYATVRKLYLDAFPATGTSGGQRYPQVNQGIANAFDLGSALIVYFGHGGPRSWSQERVITYEEINNFSNFTGLYSRLPVVLTITCDFTVWDVPEIASAGTYMFKNPTGGAVAMLTTSRPIATTYGKGFNEPIVEKLLEVNGVSYLSVGEALRVAKVGYTGSGAGVNHYSVNLLGDPMLSISRPPRDIRITKINGEDAATFTGLLRALDFVEIEGEVLNANGTSRDVTFNGKANATLFDKPINKTTLNNDGNIDVLNYQEQVNAIFKGGTNVNNGEFKFQFYVPKDINYEVGDGKLMLYAHNNVTDAVSTRTIRVGDQNPNGLDDDNGPAIGLYMNNLNFVDGGITDRYPYLLACLVDNSGINTSGVAIGHDITGVLDGNVEGTYVLNEYYEGGDNNPCTNPQFLDYQKGQVMYKLSRLALGNHQIVFKAWDINNNSSEQTLDFVVMEDGSDHIHIDKLLNWPNPFTNQTYFHFEHNCDSELDVMVQIFTISGKLVKTIRQPVSAEPWREGYRTGRFAIPWDGLDDFGDKIGKGVYIYRVTVRGVDSELCKGSATAIEKLVILK